VARDDVGGDAGELDREFPLQAPARPKRHRGRQVDEQPGGNLSLFEILTHEDAVHPRGHIPVDSPDLVARLVLAHLREIEAGSIEDPAVVAEQKPIETADDRELQPPQQLLRGLLKLEIRHACHRAPRHGIPYVASPTTGALRWLS
jgi:hypothetical protein